MPLPKIDYPILNFTLPILKKDMKFRPIVVKEEKLLLMAKASDSPSDIFITIKQIVNNCCLEKDFDIDKISLVELEYLFLRLRGYSIGNKINVSYKDAEDDKSYDFEVDVDDIKLVYPNDDPNCNIIDVTDKTKFVMKYPPASLYSNDNFLNSQDEDLVRELFINCIDKIIDSGTEYKLDLENEREEALEYIDNLDTTVYNKVQKFFESVPKMEYVIEYKNSNEKERKIVLRTLNDFFML